MATTKKEAPKRKTATAKTATKASVNGHQELTHDEIAQRAHELYVQAGRPAGRDTEFWLEAERQLREAVMA